MKFMRVLERLAHVEIATFRAGVVNPVHNWRNNYANMETRRSARVIPAATSSTSWRGNDGVTRDPDENLIFDDVHLATG